MCLSFFQGNMECCEPCCGQPCSTDEGLYCCLSWFPGCFCSAPKFYAASQDQACAWINHCLPIVLLIIPIVNIVISFALITGIRFNLRKKHAIGEAQCDIMDCLASILPCMWCQELRSMPKESWDWYKAMNDKQFPGEPKVEPCYYFCVQ
jgi:hypothetical protein